MFKDSSQYLVVDPMNFLLCLLSEQLFHFLLFFFRQLVSVQVR